MVAIDVHGLTKSFGNNHVLTDVTFSVGAGSITALLGANGAGKTTAIGILTTALAADAGTASVAGHDVHREPRAVRRAISVTGQSATVDGMLTARENLELIGRLHGMSRRAALARADELVETTGLGAAGRRRVSTYSGGMRRRLDLALSLVTPAPVVFLDEPTTGLDTRARALLWDQVRGLAHAGAAVLLTTQYLEEADQLADDVLILHAGRIVERGTPAQLKQRIGAMDVTVTDAAGTLVGTEPTDGTADGLRAALTALESRVSIPTDARITVRQPTLDDAFLAHTSEVSS